MDLMYVAPLARAFPDAKLVSARLPAAELHGNGGWPLEFGLAVEWWTFKEKCLKTPLARPKTTVNY